MNELATLNTDQALAPAFVPGSAGGDLIREAAALWGTSYQVGQLNSRVTRLALEIDIYVPLDQQQSTGLSLDIARIVRTILAHKPIGRGLDQGRTNPDIETARGWHKASVVFEYNKAN